MTAFLKAARVVADLDDDFYQDERQREVWNEASAVGFQSFQWTALVAGAVLPWIAGRGGAMVAIGILAAWFVLAMVTIAYARARDVDVYATMKTLRPRSIFAVTLYLAGVAGIYIELADPFRYDGATWAGMVVGALVGGGAAATVLMWVRRRDRRREAEEAARDAADV
ncbi:DUF2029 domain-containing protein [Rhodococcus sp. NPDC058639]|uniref:DUF2029 domain-containing protein n=1 Tax=Rhodococcus sp. NPDC058639 TaxID=3346570 RepID=UPI00364F6BEE